MRIQKLKNCWGKLNRNNKILSLVAIFCLLVNSFGIAMAGGSGLTDKNIYSTNQDSLTLIYNDINASQFPQIFSIVTVMSEFGLFIGKLDENNFEVYEDGTRELPIKVEQLTGGAMDVNVALVIDRSGSMRGQPIEDAKKASTIFVELMQNNDQTAIVSFNHQPRTDYHFSGDIDSLKEAISNIDAYGGTAIFDALIHAVYLINSSLKNRALILLTDGADKDSYHTFQEALTALISNEVRTFTIGLGLNQGSPEESILKELAEQTGGLYFYSPTSSDLEQIYRAIHKLLHSQYQVTYNTHNPAKDGTLRHVQINVLAQGHSNSDTASYRAPYEGNTDPVDTVKVEDPVFTVVPNPFTPNDDGFNDWTEFRKGEGIPENWVISIMDRAGRLVKQLRNGHKIWNGKDEAGQTMLPGTYLYIVFNGRQAIHRGFIQLVR